MLPFRSPGPSRLEAAVLPRIGSHWVRMVEEGAPVVVQVLEPQFMAAFEDAGPHADSPEVAAIARRCRERAAMAARVDAARELPVSDATIGDLVEAVTAVDPRALTREARLRYLLLCDAVSAWSQARASAALAAYAGPSASGDAVPPAAQVRRDRHLRLEVRVARTISDDAAGRDIDAARRLDAELRPVRDAWSRGEVSSRHVAAFLDRTRLCPPELVTAVLDRVGGRVTSTPSARVGSLVNAALAAIDPLGQAERAQYARRHEVGVTQRTLADGLGQITVIDRVEVTRALIERIDDVADRVLLHSRECVPCANDVPPEIGPARAAALRLLLAGSTPAGLGAPAGGSRRSRRGELQVVLDLATLLGLAENPGLVAGQPVPAGLARELAADCGSMRRIVTDPVDGHLLDYGRRTYLPQALREHVAARDGTCRAPGCGQPASRSEMDHVIPFPHGPSDVGNTAMLCRRDHTTKTDGDLEILEHRADGTTRWRTRDGQSGLTPPRPYLPDPTRPDARDPDSDDYPF